MGTLWSLPKEDLENSLAFSEKLLRRFDGSRFLITGGTGFLGSWITSSLIHGRERLGLDIEIVLLSRSGLVTELDGAPSVEVIRGDVRTLPALGQVDFVVHAATSSSARKGTHDALPTELARTAVLGTDAVLQAVFTGSRFLFLSSGAVYGPQTSPVHENDLDRLEPTLPNNDAYAEGKLKAEQLCISAARSGLVHATIARLFSFVGPRIPTDGHFAAGNFLRDLVLRTPITVQGDGTPVRSYLYAGDLPEWCWAILLDGEAGRAYNVGSDVALSIEDLAVRVGALIEPPLPVRVLGMTDISATASWYVPNIDRARDELGLSVRTDLDGALAKTAAWLKAKDPRTPVTRPPHF
jgi:nucleoside-diphosphate-sugar epimerase